MKKFLLEILICPACLPEENSLRLCVDKIEEEDIILGSLTCKKCGRIYRIEEGIAILTPDPHWFPDKRNKYENQKVVSSYLWSHYGDLIDDKEWLPAYNEWANLMNFNKGFSLDLGCAVGRFVFEMASKSDYAIGVDLSTAFIKASREIMKNRSMEFEIIQEGNITSPAKIELPHRINTEKVDFIIGDALKLPFPPEIFNNISSLNLIDKVPYPLQHIQEMNRIASKTNSQILISDPFSWSEEVTDIENWIGGKRNGKFTGFGIDNLERILKGYDNYINPPWNITHKGEVMWKIRNHRNHAELIKSLYIKAIR